MEWVLFARPLHTTYPCLHNDYTLGLFWMFVSFALWRCSHSSHCQKQVFSVYLSGIYMDFHFLFIDSLSPLIDLFVLFRLFIYSLSAVCNCFYLIFSGPSVSALPGFFTAFVFRCFPCEQENGIILHGNWRVLHLSYVRDSFSPWLPLALPSGNAHPEFTIHSLTLLIVSPRPCSLGNKLLRDPVTQTSCIQICNYHKSGRYEALCHCIIIITLSCRWCWSRCDRACGE